LDPDYQHRNAINSDPLIINNGKLDGRDDFFFKKKNQQITPGTISISATFEALLIIFYRWSGYNTPFVIHSEFIVLGLGWGGGSRFISYRFSAMVTIKERLLKGKDRLKLGFLIPFD
jgi:hypothetical protein